MKQKIKIKLILFAIIILAATLRVYNLDWDQGNHLHPDERAIIMSVASINFPKNLHDFLTPASPLNPHFFAYGNFPFYLLRIVGGLLSYSNPLLSQYGMINLPGRFISSIFDLVTIYFIFLLGKKIFNETTGILAAFFYAISVLPIQLSHFYAVDTILTCFILITLYSLCLFYEKPNIRKALLIGIFLGLSVATKISAVVLLVSIGTALIIDFLLLIMKNPRGIHLWRPHLSRYATHLIQYGIIVAIIAFGIFAIFEPYAFIDYANFIQQMQLQSLMTHNAFIFPYTLQYVGKIPYLYDLKNIFLWGLGPLISVFSFSGLFIFTHQAFHKDKQGGWAKELIIFIFFLAYFTVVGKFAIGFMRYMLPLYPFFALFAGLALYKFIKYVDGQIKNNFFLFAFCCLLFASFLVWPLSFMHIYTKPNTRTSATRWINSTIPPGRILAIEHWDDALPLQGADKYRMLTLALYDPDTDSKWQTISQELQVTDYIIIASNRLYVPLQKLTDCPHLPPGKCYTRTADYYKKLFSGELGFQKVAEFSSNPTLPFFNVQINDQSADESFTVYDHPKIMIFKNVRTIH